MRIIMAEFRKDNVELWTEITEADSKLLNVNFKELWAYRDLLFLLVRRDFSSVYKQTILGPLWIVLQPVMVMLMFSLIFGRIAGLSTGGVPILLFYLAGIVLWSYFSECLSKTSTVFKDNANLFGKVYFPRLIIPLSIIVSNLIRLSIQFSIFLALWLYYFSDQQINPNSYLLLFPLLILLMACLSLGLGMLITASTTKYRDLAFLLTFGIQLLMYASPVVYPMSALTGKYKILIQLNPMSSIFETFRFGFLGIGSFSWAPLIYTALITFSILFLGVIVFNKVEKGFMDTV